MCPLAVGCEVRVTHIYIKMYCMYIHTIHSSIGSGYSKETCTEGILNPLFDKKPKARKAWLQKPAPDEPSFTLYEHII